MRSHNNNLPLTPARLIGKCKHAARAVFLWILAVHDYYSSKAFPSLGTAADIKIGASQFDTPRLLCIIHASVKARDTAACVRSLFQNPPSIAFCVKIIGANISNIDEDILPLIEKGSLVEILSGTQYSSIEWILAIEAIVTVTNSAIDDLIISANEVIRGEVFVPALVTQAGDIVTISGNDDIRKPEYGYLREVSVALAAVFLVRRKHMQLVDNALQGACDLVAGRIVSQPAARFIVKAQDAAFRQVLTYKPLANDDEPLFLSAALLEGTPVVMRNKFALIVEYQVPEIDRNAGAKNIYDFAKSLVVAGWTVKYWPKMIHAEANYIRLLTDIGVEVFCGYQRPNLGNWLRKQGEVLGYVMLCRPDIADQYIDTIRKNTLAPIIYYGHDLHSARMEMEANVTGDVSKRAAAKRMAALEQAIWRASDAVLYPTKEEVGVVSRLEPNVKALSINIYCFDTFHYRNEAAVGANILFVGGFKHAPNVDAVMWFANEVFPFILQHRPDAKFVVIGSSVPPIISSLASENVLIRGWVDDGSLRAEYQAAKVCVVPLRFGAGLKLKVVEGMSMGVPLATTSVGVQGLEDIDNVTPPRDDPADLADMILRLLNSDDEGWLNVSEKQVDYVSSRFGRKAMVDQLVRTFNATD